MIQSFPITTISFNRKANFSVLQRMCDVVYGGWVVATFRKERRLHRNFTSGF